MGQPAMQRVPCHGSVSKRRFRLVRPRPSVELALMTRTARHKRRAATRWSCPERLLWPPCDCHPVQGWSRHLATPSIAWGGEPPRHGHPDARMAVQLRLPPAGSVGRRLCSSHAPPVRPISPQRPRHPVSAPLPHAEAAAAKRGRDGADRVNETSPLHPHAALRQGQRGDRGLATPAELQTLGDAGCDQVI